MVHQSIDTIMLSLKERSDRATYASPPPHQIYISPSSLFSKIMIFITDHSLPTPDQSFSNHFPRSEPSLPNMPTYHDVH